MAALTMALALVAAMAAVAAAGGVRTAAARSMLHSSDDLAIAAALAARAPAASNDLAFPPPQYVEQLQDHNDPSNTNTWMQAFYVNDEHWVPGSDAPVFICVGGEGPPLDGSAVVSSVHCNNAVEWLPETRALMFAVEHRYYGCHNMSACPVKSFGNPTESLKYLSSFQALQDLEHFVQYATKRWKLTASNKIVSWGGSYPGMLAGWFRLKFPHLVHASVASSAPVLAQLDMRGYNDVTAAAYAVSDEKVGGSPECEDAIRTGHANLKPMFDSEAGRQKLSKLFGEEPSFYASKENQAAFCGNGVAYFPAQGNDPTCTEKGCNIKMICEIMTNTSIVDPVARLAALARGQVEWIGKKKWEHKETLVADVPDFWGYQTCTEFGFYQTCEVGSKCFYTQGYVLLDDMASFCQSDYGISIEKISENINKTNAFYGGLNPAGSCILYPNGEVDPWHALSILTSPSSGIPVLMVAGASHHAWTHPSTPEDQQSVIAARQTIRSQVTSFLKESCIV